VEVSGVTTLAAIVVLIAANQLVRFPIARRIPAIFWIVAVADGALAVTALLWGLPGLIPTAGWIVAALFLYHLVQNLQTRAQWIVEEREEHRAALYEERERQRAVEEEAGEARTHAPPEATEDR
jgi:fatty acid desaturase